MEENYINGWAKEFVERDLKLQSEIKMENVPSDLIEEYKVYKKTWKIIEEMQDIEQFDTDSAWNKLYSKIEDEKGAGFQKKDRKFTVNKLIAVAASIILLMGVGSFIFLNNNKVFTHVNDTLIVSNITLPDGSVVYLNATAALNYTKSFGDKSRTVVLKGEAFFEVARDVEKPFIVKANETIVKVLGTSFSVNTNSEERNVIVKTGKVEVMSAINPMESVVLMPGEFASKTENGIQKHINVNENYLSWVNKKLIFKALPLSVVINDLMKTYPCSISLADTSLGNLKITTTFDNDSIEDVLESIALAFNLKIEKEGKKFILVSN